MKEVAWFEGAFAGILIPEIRSPPISNPKIPWLRRLLGDQPVKWIVPLPGARKQDIEEMQATFPEAKFPNPTRF
jgi:hypothetical protein